MTTEQTHDHEPVPVAPGNLEQYAAWSGDEGRLWADHPGFFDDGVRELHAALMAAADIAAGERVLDVGCGNGQCTREAARQAHPGTALGIDLSVPMIAAASASVGEEGPANASFVAGDAQSHPFEPGSFDLVLSRTGTMFFAEQVAAFRNIARALRPGGRLAMVSWRSAAENEWIGALAGALRPDVPPPRPPEEAPSPFRHADRDATRAILESAGFEAIALTPLDAHMYLGRDADEGFGVMSRMLGWMVQDVDSTAREHAMTRLYRTLEEHETPDGVSFGCAAWLITARRGR